MMKPGFLSKFMPHFLETLIAITFSLTLVADITWARPPFVTDDPEPVEHHHWEVYLTSQNNNSTDGTSGTAPHLEVNYGVAPNTQIHIIIPAAYANPNKELNQYGLGDIELGVKYRFIQETDSLPQAGVFPLIELPTGNSYQRLGEGHTRIFLPVWFQKSRGPWTTYGGGGFWYNNAGAGNKNYWQTDWAIQRDISKKITLGAKIFNLSASAKNEGSETGFNFGTIVNFSEEHHLLLSASSDIDGPNNFFMYIAYQWTFGPGKSVVAPNN